MKKKPTAWIRPEISRLSAYHVPDASGFVKLDAMENPYHWSDEMIGQWLEVIRQVELNRYPEPSAPQLTQRIRDCFSIPEQAAILLGNGSDELIQMILMAVGGRDRVVMSLEPGFVMYNMIATFLDMPYVGVALDENFELDKTAMLAAIKQHDPAVIFFAYPNNPTGNLFDEQAIVEVIEATDAIVVLDEAYYAFTEHTFMNRLNQYDNLLVMRTVSKMGLAGLRLGYLAGAPELVNEFDKVRLPYNINVLTQASAIFALDHVDALNKQTGQIKQDRETLFNELNQCSELKVFPSAANFILFRTPAGKADMIFDALKQQQILIKNLNRPDSPLTDCLRVTVGTEQENRQFVAALKNVLANV